MRTCFWLGLVYCFPMSGALACTQLEPAAAFILINDRNQDQYLDPEEWRNARSDNLLTSFQVGDMQEFLRFDVNHNQKLRAVELGFDSVRYIREPCSDWQARTLRHSRFKSHLQGFH